MQSMQTKPYRNVGKRNEKAFKMPLYLIQTDMMGLSTTSLISVKDRVVSPEHFMIFQIVFKGSCGPFPLGKSLYFCDQSVVTAGSLSGDLSHEQARVKLLIFTYES